MLNKVIQLYVVKELLIMVGKNYKARKFFKMVVYHFKVLFLHQVVLQGDLPALEKYDQIQFNQVRRAIIKCQETDKPRC